MKIRDIKLIKVLGLALYGSLAASNRYRLGQYIPGLEQHGISLQMNDLLGNLYLSQSFQGKSIPVAYILKKMLQRSRLLLSKNDYDLIILHCELFPLMPWWIEGILLNKPYIYDFDDAFYMKYRQKRFVSVNPFLKNKFDKVITNASAITAGNHSLVNYSRTFNWNANYLPTVVDTDRYVAIKKEKCDDFTIGWIGAPSTAQYLTELIEPLTRLAKFANVRFVVVGGHAPLIPNMEVIELAWSEFTEVDIINTFDVGVMPLPDDEWARGKCAFKLIQYMACGVPVVSSRVGANIDVVTSVCGFLVNSADEWFQGLSQLLENQDLRHKMGSAGRNRVEKKYSLARNLPVFAEVIRSVVEKGSVK